MQRLKVLVGSGASVGVPMVTFLGAVLVALAGCGAEVAGTAAAVAATQAAQASQAQAQQAKIVDGVKQAQDAAAARAPTAAD